MNSLEFEFERFKEQALIPSGLSEEDMVGARLIFMCGALAQADRILSFLDSDLPANRKHAMLRRIARECQRFQSEVTKAMKEETTHTGEKK